MFLAIVLISLNLVSSSKSASKDDDEIKNLPGIDFNVTFKHYSGFFQVNETRFLHYWFVESQSDPETDPLIFWFNGGPLCSSLFGLLTENGPYFVSENGRLTRNLNSWNLFANVVYLESPAGVGYSYATEEYTADDDQTARENRNAIIGFFERFPEFQGRSTFITGESYGGVYVPTLAVQIINGQQEFPINLTGIAIGNGCVDSDRNVNASLARMAYYKGAVDLDEWDTAEEKCCNGSVNTCDIANLDGECDTIYEKFSSGLYNSYDIYFNCDHEDFSRKHGHDVRDALHISQVEPNLSTWTQCDIGQNNIYVYKPLYDSMHEVVQKVIQENVRVLLFYGDADTVCNYVAGEWFSRNLRFKKLHAKRLWKFDKNPAGFVTTYDGLTYTTILDSGHMVAAWAPKRAFYMIKNFVNDEPL